MNMKLGLVFASLLLALVPGCHVEVGDGFDDDEARSLSSRAERTCDDYCESHVSCGTLEASDFLACRDLCIDEYEDDEDAVSDGCECVVEASCNVEMARSCEDDPLAGIWFSGGDSSEKSSSGSEDKKESSGDSGDDSGAGCVASCQCAEGLVCEAGSCTAPVDPPQDCDSDCDCTSGESCVEGLCQ